MGTEYHFVIRSTEFDVKADFLKLARALFNCSGFTSSHAVKAIEFKKTNARILKRCSLVGKQCQNNLALRSCDWFWVID